MAAQERRPSAGRSGGGTSARARVALVPGVAEGRVAVADVQRPRAACARRGRTRCCSRRSQSWSSTRQGGARPKGSSGSRRPEVALARRRARCSGEVVHGAPREAPRGAGLVVEQRGDRRARARRRSSRRRCARRRAAPAGSRGPGRAWASRTSVPRRRVPMPATGAWRTTSSSCVRSFAASSWRPACCPSSPVATAQAVVPQPASAFRDSVGVSTHIVYYDTPYGDWPKVVQRLRQLGVRHVRDGVYANPAPQWRDWNERYYQRRRARRRAGMRFDFGMGRPGSETGTLDQLLDVVGGRLRGATDALEAPNEFDHFVGGRRWPGAARPPTGASSTARRRRAPPCATLPVIGPSLMAPRRAPAARRPARVPRRREHPPLHGRPDARRRRTCAPSSRAMSSVSGRKPVWATEAGLPQRRSGPATASRRSPRRPGRSTSCARSSSTSSRASGAPTPTSCSTSPPSPALRRSEQHFGLLRHDFSPKPAYTALRNLLALMGPDQAARRRPRAGAPRPLRARLGRAPPRPAAGRRDLLVALWRLDSVWNRTTRRAVRVEARRVTVAAARRGRRPRRRPGRRDDVGAYPARRPRARRAGRRPARPRGDPPAR